MRRAWTGSRVAALRRPAGQSDRHSFSALVLLAERCSAAHVDCMIMPCGIPLVATDHHRVRGIAEP